MPLGGLAGLCGAARQVSGEDTSRADDEVTGARIALDPVVTLCWIQTRLSDSPPERERETIRTAACDLTPQELGQSPGPVGVPHPVRARHHWGEVSPLRGKGRPLSAPSERTEGEWRNR